MGRVFDERSTLDSPVISVRSLSKKYEIGALQRRATTLPEAMIRTLMAPIRGIRGMLGDREGVETHWALRDVSFDVRQGDLLGIIGRNGAGKSTLLKILSRITSPTSGEVRIQGRLASLLEVGTGFHAELTGRENIYLNGAILGMRRQEITDRFDEIVGFSGVEKFLDTPVKRYSSGMYVRLAFSVAAHLRSDILIVDEVLSVGDTEFQKRCLGKMDEATSRGTTVLFVSHHMPTINRLCDRCIWLNDGEVAMDGRTELVTGRYLQESVSSHAEYLADPARTPTTESSLILRAVRIRDHNGQVSGSLDARQPCTVEIEHTWTRAEPGGWVGFTIQTPDGATVLSTATADRLEYSGRTYAPGTYRAVCTIPGDFLNLGRYLITVYGVRSVGGANDIILDQPAVSFDVETIGVGAHLPGPRVGVICPALPWRVEVSDRDNPAP